MFRCEERSGRFSCRRIRDHTLISHLSVTAALRFTLLRRQIARSLRSPEGKPRGGTPRPKASPLRGRWSRRDRMRRTCRLRSVMTARSEESCPVASKILRRFAPQNDNAPQSKNRIFPHIRSTGRRPRRPVCVSVTRGGPFLLTVHNISYIISLLWIITPVKRSIRKGGRMTVSAGPEEGDEDGSLSKDSADAATAFAAGREGNDKKRNQNRNRAIPDVVRKADRA